MEILLCTDGSGSSIMSADLVTKLKFPSSSRVVVLGVSDNKINVGKINLTMDTVNEKLGGKYTIVHKIRYGNPADEILAEAIEFPYDLVVIGGGSGQLGLLRPELGTTASQLTRKLHTHFLVVRSVPDEIGKILICVGGGAPASETMTLGGAWVANITARIGLLHVIPLRSTGLATDLGTGRNDTSPTGKEKGTHNLVLEQAKQQLITAGVKNEIEPRIRQGLVADEVLMELSEGKYDLLVVGAHYQRGQDLWMGTLFDDITDQLLNRSNCSILII